MTKQTIAYLLVFLFLSCNSQKENESTQTQEQIEETDNNFVDISTDADLIATALLAAPKEFRDGCKVIGTNMKGEFVTMKQGTNDLICLADDPSKDGFNAACYHKDMEPFMARGRELRKEGMSATEIFDKREEEVKAGTLKMGEYGSTLHIYYGPDTRYDPDTKEVENAKYRYVVYMPYATAASTGLPERPVAANHPWIMNPGTHRAHIMISPINE